MIEGFFVLFLFFIFNPTEIILIFPIDENRVLWLRPSVIFLGKICDFSYKFTILRAFFLGRKRRKTFNLHDVDHSFIENRPPSDENL